MQKSILISLLCVVCLLCGFSAVCADTVTVAVHPDSKPFVYLNENDEVNGIDAEVISAIAGIEGFDVEFVRMDFEEMLEAVASCEVNAGISSITKTEEREKTVSFSEPYVVASQFLFIKKDRTDITSLESEGVKTAGAKADSTSDVNLREFADGKDVEIKTYADYPELFAALESGEIDVAVSDDFLGKRFVDEYDDIITTGTPISEEPYAIAVCPSDTELLETLNHGLAELKSSGTVDYIVQDNLK